MNESELKVFNPKELAEESKKERTTSDPVLGTIKYHVLTMGDLKEINKVSTNEDRSIRVLYLVLRESYPGITEEDVRAFGLDAVQRLLKIIAGPAGFLQVDRPVQVST